MSQRPTTVVGDVTYPDGWDSGSTSPGDDYRWDIPQDQKNKFTVLMSAIIGAGILGGVTWFLFQYEQKNAVPAEFQMSIVVVVAIVALMLLLYAVATGFSGLGLTDRTQALGLPEGSIRAMIALILILVFIIFGLYLFRLTGQGIESGPVVYPRTELGTITNMARVEQIDGDPNNLNVWLRTDISEDGRRLSQQLVTTVGTLVVAVAGFYFGSSSISQGYRARRPDVRRATNRRRLGDTTVAGTSGDLALGGTGEGTTEVVTATTTAPTATTTTLTTAPHSGSRIGDNR